MLCRADQDDLRAAVDDAFKAKLKSLQDFRLFTDMSDMKAALMKTTTSKF